MKHNPYQHLELFGGKMIKITDTNISVLDGVWQRPTLKTRYEPTHFSGSLAANVDHFLPLHPHA